jgi:hypothetical protein
VPGEEGGDVRKLALVFTVMVTVAALTGASYALARGGDHGKKSFRASLNGWNENPSVVTPGDGSLRMTLDDDVLKFTLEYEDMQADVTQAHIHIGGRFENGGISVFFCGPQPAAGDKPVCPLREGTVTGEIDAADVIGPNNQGVGPMEFDRLVEAIKHGDTYANVHTTRSPSGEIRGQIRRGHGRG